MKIIKNENNNGFRFNLCESIAEFDDNSILWTKEDKAEIMDHLMQQKDKYHQKQLLIEAVLASGLSIDEIRLFLLNEISIASL